MLDLSKPLTAGKIKEYFKNEYGAVNSYFSQGERFAVSGTASCGTPSA